MWCTLKMMWLCTQLFVKNIPSSYSPAEVSKLFSTFGKVHKSVYMYVCVHVYVCVFVYVYMYVCVCVCVWMVLQREPQVTHDQLCSFCLLSDEVCKFLSNTLCLILLKWAGRDERGSPSTGENLYRNQHLPQVNTYYEVHVYAMLYMYVHTSVIHMYMLYIHTAGWWWGSWSHRLNDIIPLQP